MSEKTSPAYAVLHLRLKLRVPPDNLLAHSREAGEKIASAEGLIWKVWVYEEEPAAIGGIYLFANREAAVSYLNHPVIQAVCSNPAVVNTDVQLWNVESGLSAVTRAPLPDIRVQSQELELALTGGR